MSAARHVVAGLAHVRSPWFVEVARWSTLGALPIEFIKCLSVEELQARVTGGRPFSAALLDARLPSVDRDLLAALAGLGIAPLVVAEPGATASWTHLGAAAVLAPDFDRAQLLDALTTHSHPVAEVARGSSLPAAASTSPGIWRAPVVAVTGTAGCGTSTVAAALAQAVAGDPRHGESVVLADLARRAHQGLLHDARDVAPGVQELVEGHRGGHLGPEAVRALTHAVPQRRYHLLLGLRRPDDWVAVRAEAFRAALTGLTAAHRLVIADVDADLEGEQQTGSIDVEERNLMARHTTAVAAAVVVVALGTTTGFHDLVHHLLALHQHGVDGDRIIVALNRSPRRPRARAEQAATLADLTAGLVDGSPYRAVTFVPERRGVEQVHRDVARFPSALVSSLATAVLDRLDHRGPLDDAPDPDLIGNPVVPGSLGRWSGEEPAGA